MEKNTKHFAEVCWDEIDMENALDVMECDTSEENISKLYELIDEDMLAEIMIDAGWSYIYDVISNNQSEFE